MKSSWTIIFDFGNTLAPFNEREAEAITADIAACAERRAGIGAASFTASWLAERDADFRRSAVSGEEHDFGARLSRVLAGAGRAPEPALCAEIEACAVESFVRHVRVDAEIGAALPALAARCRLGVLSNYLLSEPIHRVLARDGVHGLFAKVIVSKETGFAKPDPRCFDAIVRALALQRERTAYVGDDYRIDVEGALRAGLRPVWTWALRTPLPAEPDTPHAAVRRLRTRGEYLRFLGDPDAVLDAAASS
ncbi:MAG TPA: hypothetical protein DCM87_00130 [Planctomycetes bacterium]|nr:hypothetical protein [Planctomycetota bacterium]